MYTLIRSASPSNSNEKPQHMLSLRKTEEQKLWTPLLSGAMTDNWEYSEGNVCYFSTKTYLVVLSGIVSPPVSSNKIGFDGEITKISTIIDSAISLFEAIDNVVFPKVSIIVFELLSYLSSFSINSLLLIQIVIEYRSYVVNNIK